MKRKEKEKQIILSQSFLSTIECFPKMFTSSCVVTSSALSVFLSGTKILLFSPSINNHNLPAIIDGYVTFIITNKYTIFFKIYPLVDPFAANKIIHTSWYFYIIILAFAPACACSSSAWWNIIFKDLHDSSINVKIKCIKSTETETMQCFLTCFWVAEKEYSYIFFYSNCYRMDFEQCINFQSTFTFLFTADHSLVVGEYTCLLNIPLNLITSFR